MRIATKVLLAALACAVRPLAAQDGEPKLLQVAASPDGVVLALDSGTIVRTADSTFLASAFYRYPPATAERFGLDTEVERQEMDCARTKLRARHRWGLKDGLPVATREADTTAAQRTTWLAVSDGDLPIFGALCQYLLGSFAAALPLRAPGSYVERQPELVNRSDVTRRISALYPLELRRDRITGEAVLRLRVTTDGRVDTDSVRVVRTTATEFGHAAVQVAREMRFHPATIDGRPVATWVTLPIRFALAGRR
ncbi:MAG TPA: energy transducer TonB [Longimicrobiaceae bacterium]